MDNLQGNNPLDSSSVFERLFHQYSKSVYYFFRRRGFTEEESSDLTQDTFHRAYRGLPEATEDHQWTAWLFTIAANVWRNEIRRRTAEKRDAAEVSFEEVSDSGSLWRFSPSQGDPLGDTLKKERFRRLYSAMGELPEQMRHCLALRILHNLKYKEIATIMQVSINTVKSQLFQARKRLQAQLGPD